MKFASYFVFNKTERIGILTIFILIFLIILIPRVFFLHREQIQVKQDSILAYLTAEQTPQKNQNNTPKDSLAYNPNQTLKFEKKTDNQKKLNLNTCDSLELIQLPGIGEKTTKKILQTRRKVKFFYGLDQLSCIGLHPDIVQRLRQYCYIENNVHTQIQKISLNQIDDKSIFRLPGFSYDIAKSFIKFRKYLKKQGKSIRSWEEITQNVEGIDNQWMSCWQIYYELT
ncbi:MAG: helix-hairpin-helix domain-containing protein [Bacteroidia bacterium]|nr:helix-hairpin-helix domain-containing protein [Bacteroidia bacterium]MDW8346538.1 helix-hairpin-helix domain-containing protein [Bacteroidia bacterium]